VSLQNGVGFWLSHCASLKSGVSLNYMLGRHQSTDVHYQGLGDKSGSVDVYAFAEWQPILDAVTLYANAASTPAPMQREFLQAGVTLGIPMFNLWNAFVDFNQTWGNAPYWQTYYGVSAQQQATSMKAVFMPTSGGALYQSKTLGGVYSVNKSTDLILGLGALEASQSLMQSPVMGARVQHTGVIMINQKFVSH
jgi:outer membrane scaffolding protein for murein synthesis (MipA/OmpV family)